MNISNHMNVQGKSAKDIKKCMEKQTIGKVTDVANGKHTEAKDTVRSALVKPKPTLLYTRTRSIHFRVNEETKEMFIEVTNSDNEVVRTIPADENDPKFMSPVAQSSAGSYVNRTR